MKTSGFIWVVLIWSAAVYFCYSQAKADEAGLLTPEVIINILEESVIGIETDDTGTTTTETITTTTTTTTITNEDSGDILDGDNDFVGTKFEGDMDKDWGGQGPASMPSGSTCGDLGTDKCAQITGSGNFTSSQGVPNIGTTFIQTIDITDLNFSIGGKTTYSIAVDKNDAADSISFHITGKDGSTVSFAGTDTLSAAGVNSGFEVYTGGFDFAGSLTSLIVEVSGRDINLSIGPLFDDVQINVLFNVISTIVTEGITTIETFIALETFDDVTIDIATDIFVNNNVSVGPTGDIDISPIEEYDDASYDDVVAEIETEIGGLEEYDDGSYDMDYGSDMDTGMELTMDMDYGEDPGGYEMEPLTTDTVETEMMAEVDFGPDMEMEMDMDYGPDMDADMMPEPEYDDTTTVGTEPDYGPEPEMDTSSSMDMEPEPESGEITVAAAEPEPEPEPTTGEPEPEPEPEPTTDESEPEPEPEASEPEPEEAEPEPEPEEAAEPEPEPQEAEEESEPETKVAKAEEKKEEPKAEAKEKPKSRQEKKQEAKQKAANKIVKKMGDKGRYDDNNQAKTLIIMQVLGNTKDFFDQGSVLKDAEIFYEVTRIPDTVISDNNYAQYMLFGGSDAAHDELTNLQYGDE